MLAAGFIADALDDRCQPHSFDRLDQRRVKNTPCLSVANQADSDAHFDYRRRCCDIWSAAACRRFESGAEAPHSIRHC
jgi:hypothetical protein